MTIYSFYKTECKCHSLSMTSPYFDSGFFIFAFNLGQKKYKNNKQKTNKGKVKSIQGHKSLTKNGKPTKEEKELMNHQGPDMILFWVHL